jgi:hypothetical protein
MKYNCVLVIPDLQIPFQHPYALTFLKMVRDEYKPDLVVCVGDEWDNCALSRYPKDPDGMSAGDEYRRARRASKAYYEAFPDVYLCESNHRERLYKRAYEAGIPKDLIKDTSGYMGSPPGWRWADQWIFDGVVYEHGDRASGANAGERLMDANHASVVYGHHHDSPGVTYRQKANKTMFAMNVGCLIDKDAYAMSYTRHNRSKPVLSCGIVLDGTPHVLPMIKGLRYR